MSMRGSSMTLPPGLDKWPPTVTAAVWKALEDRTEQLAAARGRRVESETSVRVRVSNNGDWAGRQGGRKEGQAGRAAKKGAC